MQFELNWIAGPNTSTVPAERLTRCHLAFRFKGHELFRHEDLLGGHQVKDSITVSAYPLAVWFAANWWRLRWEPGLSPDSESVLHDWKMSHSLAAAGEGYAWPDLTFSSDDENIQLNLKPGHGGTGPLRYLERLEAWVPADEYEAGVDDLINQTLEQLNSSTGPTPLHQLWQTVLEERASPSLALQRQLEAKLGYDPEEAPESLLIVLNKLASEHGEGAVQELACLGHKNARKTIQDAEQYLAESGELINLPMKSVRPFTKLLADGIYAGETGNWLPCTDAATARQKFQRAFAQEFLCPYNDLIEWMDTTSPDEETMEAAAERFEVSPLLVNTVMVNRGHIPRSGLEAFQQAV
ncbi:MAG: hypothetical protein SWN10_23075 [Pseudomonadota bacterium]|nr:hypothetical protein [Pseudomonadota bacterium]